MLFLISIIVTVIANALLGIFILFRNPKNIHHRIFFLLTVSIVGWIVTLFIYYAMTDSGNVLFFGRLNFSIAIYIGLFFFLFAYYFPVIFSKLPKKVPLIAAVATTIISVLTQVTDLVDKSEIIQGTERVMDFGSLYLAYIGLLLAFILGGIIVFILKVRSLEGAYRSQVKLVLYGFFYFFLIGMTTNFVLPFYFNLADMQAFGPVATIFITGFATVAISKHKLFDIRALTARTVTYVVLVAMFGLIYAGVLFLISVSLVPVTNTNVFLSMATLLTLFVGFTFRPLERFVGRITNSLLYKQDYDLNTVVLKLSQRMNTTLQEEVFVKDILNELQKIINTTAITVFIYKNEQITEIVTLNEENNLLKDIPFEDLVRLHSEERILVLDEIIGLSGVKNIMTNYDLHVYVPLIIQKQFVGCILMGPKSSGEIYFSKDIELLHIFAPEFALALNNAHNYEEIKRFNITLQEEVKRATEQLRQANSHLQELDKMKDEFLSIASHDLRTPMTAMKGYLWLMLKKINQMPPDMAEKLHRIYNSSERMIALINDMLDVSRIESGRIQIVPQVFDIADLISDVEQELHGQVEDEKLTLQINASSHLVVADRNRTHEVLVNLIGNAVKFTPEGGTITVNTTDQPDIVEISVTDTGIGIKEEDISKLFGKFVRIDTSNTPVSQVPGTGLGLYICKKIVELSGGTISVSSEFGKGTTFRFSLKKITNKQN